MTKKVAFSRLKKAFHKYSNKTKRKNKTGHFSRGGIRL